MKLLTKKEIKEGLMKAIGAKDQWYDEILVNSIRLEKYKKEENKVSVYKIIISLEYIDGIDIGVIKNRSDEWLYENNIQYSGILLDI